MCMGGEQGFDLGLALFSQRRVKGMAEVGPRNGCQMELKQNHWQWGIACGKCCGPLSKGGFRSAPETSSTPLPSWFCSSRATLTLRIPEFIIPVLA